MNNKIDFFRLKIENSSSNLEELVYLEAINLINNDVNHDKVCNWVNVVINTFNNKPQPLSEREIQNRNKKKIRKQQLRKKVELLNTQLEELLNKHGVVVIGLFEWKEINESEYDLLVKYVKNKGYFFTDIGDGALEPFITRESIDDVFFKKYKELKHELEDINGINHVFNGYFIDDVSEFRKIILSLVGLQTQV
jgi:hypothetical protein